MGIERPKQFNTFTGYFEKIIITGRPATLFAKRHRYSSFPVNDFKEQLRTTAFICSDKKYKLCREFMNNNLRNYTFTRAAAFWKS